MFLKKLSDSDPVPLVELDSGWWQEVGRPCPAVFLSDSPSLVWCELDESLLKRLILSEGHSFQAADSVLVVSSGGRRIAVLPAAVLLPLVWVSVYLGLDGVPVLSIFGKSFPIEVSPPSYVVDDRRVQAPRGSFLESWNASNLLRVKAIADYWK